MAEQIKNNGEEPEQAAKTKYWREFAEKHLSEMRAIFRGGKLWRKEGYTVAEHSLPQGAAAEALSDMLQLPDEQKEELIKNALCHDWDKRLEVKPEDFAEKDRKKALDFEKKLGLNPDLLLATKVGFERKIIAASESGKAVPISQLLMFYTDAITSGSRENTGEFLSLEDRQAEAKPRHPELTSEYWVNEIKAKHIAQNKIYELLRENGVQIERAEDIPALLTRTIEAKYDE